MARPISWFSRLSEIRTSVEKSARSHWDTSDFGELFQLQPRAAHALMCLLPRGRGPGRSSLVAREALLRFLEDVERTGTLPTERVKASRKKVRTMTLKPARDVGRGSVEQIPATVAFEPDEVRIRHKGCEDLVEQLWALALAARDDEYRFRQLVGVMAPAAKKPNEADTLEAEIREMEAAYAKLA